MPNPRKLALFSGAIAFALGAKAADAPRMKIGASYMTLNNIFFDPMNASASEAAKKAGADYIVVDSRSGHLAANRWSRKFGRSIGLGNHSQSSRFRCDCSGCAKCQ